MPYATFTAEDFCKDPSFIGWVLRPTNESDRFWQAIMADYPHKVADIQLAIELVRTVHFREIEPSEADLTRLKQRIWADIDPPVRVVAWYRRPSLAVAAVVVLVASVGFGWWVYRGSAMPTYQTTYGTIQTINLADGSRVTLNANSSLRVAGGLAGAGVREVWLNGEAYFNIAKRNGARFIVHTTGAMVEVLGTEFNVNTRRDQTKVVLHEGKVKLTPANQPPVLMKPGDMATVMPQSRQTQLKKVQPAVYEAWKEACIVLDGKSLAEIVATLEDTFGVRISVSNPDLLTRPLSGKLRTTMADDCIDNLASILEADVKKNGDTYVVE